MSDPRNWFSLLKPGSEASNYALSFLPKDIMTRTPRQREAIVRHNRWRALCTGVLAPGAPDSAEGIALLGWSRQQAADNAGLGPTFDCGSLFTTYSILCAAVGIYTRLVAAVGPAGPDDQGEYWDEDQQSWVLALVGCNAHYNDLRTGNRMSYMDLSLAVRAERTDFAQSSETGGYPIHPAFEPFRQWHLWMNDAVIGNGNSIYQGVGGGLAWNLWRVWPPAAGKTTVFDPQYIVDPAPKHLMYPDPTKP